MIQNHASPQEEYRQSFVRHLVNRLEAVEQRIQRFMSEGWDLGALTLLHDDVQRLTGSAGRYDLIVPSQRLLMLEQLIGEQLRWARIPDPQQGERMLSQLASVRAALESLPEFQKLFSKTAPVAPATVPGAGSSAIAGAAPATALASGSVGPRSLLMVSDENAVATELAKRLKEAGWEVGVVHGLAGLAERLRAAPPAAIVVDPSKAGDLPAVAKARREAEQRPAGAAARIRLVALAPEDNLQTRLEARRAGVDTLIFPPFGGSSVLRQVQGESIQPAEDAVRVLIVEDDPSQALFAQSVLVNAGMHAQVELEALRVLQSLQKFHPDLILMDLHMPDADGVELTALIREHPAFMDTPIVFLTGESDPEARVDATKAGGDDYLTKPIRPNALIAAVESRVRRRRVIAERDRQLSVRNERSGLYRRSYLFDRVNDALGAASDQGSQTGGLLFLEVQEAAVLRDRFGLVVLERLLADASRVLASLVGEGHVAALINDYAFVVLATDLDDVALDALARRVREGLGRHYFEEDGKPLKLTVAVGICPLRYRFDDASALIHAAERTCREARVSEHAILAFSPAATQDSDPDTSLARQIRDAVASDGFGLIYQPIAAIQGGHQAQYQTLLRLRDQGGHLVPAAEILPLAERGGLMIEIDRWVLGRAMSVLAQQRELGRDVRLFVPQALTSLAARDQEMFLKMELGAHELSGRELVLECRLADALLNPPALLAFAQAMRSTGLQLCLGQYEHTADAQRLLDQVPLGFIKLAPKYVEEGVAKPLRDELRALSERAHRSGIQVIGHRVEDPQTAMILRMYGVDYIQGNFVQGANDELAFDFNAALV